MKEDIKKVNISHFEGITYYQSLKNIYLTHNCAISRAQIVFLICLSTFTPPFTVSLLIDKFKMSKTLVYYYLHGLTRLGLVERIAIGKYQITSKGFDLVKSFDRDRNSRLNRPFKWTL